MIKNESVIKATLEANEWEGELDDADLLAINGGALVNGPLIQGPLLSTGDVNLLYKSGIGNGGYNETNSNDNNNNSNSDHVGSISHQNQL